MPPIIEGPPQEGDAKRPWRERLLWFAALWCAGLAATAGLAYVLRALIMP